jgi:uncharacterized protein YyaL (SSP411 family)
MAVTALFRLAALTGRADFRERAEQTLKAYRGLMADNPAAAGQMLVALDFYLGPAEEVAIIGAKSDPETSRALRVIRSRFAPNRVVAFHDPAAGPPSATIPLLADRPMQDGRVTVYVCQNYSCAAPLVGAEAIEQALGGQKQ